ncbi:MAG: glucose-1-phosphate adenylyltransferase [Gallionellaceae bacterium]|nr:glucose-1-phosphate adenylyltransferase [Gallionellaceae bacterium]
MQHTYALVLAGGRGTRLGPLTARRAKPAVPFGGKFSIIDFALSNCVNSGIRRIGVLTQYKAQSLIRHIERGWSFLDVNLGEFIDVVPAQQRVDEQWYTGTANAVYQNLDMICEIDPDLVLILAGDHVYKMDYSRLVEEHVRTLADVTVACLEVPLEAARGFGIVGVDAETRITRFDEKPAQPRPLPERPDHALASMGIYVFDNHFLCEQLRRDADDPSSSHDFGHDLLPWLVPRCRVMAHHFEDSCVSMVGDRPYWRDVGTLDAYWAANMDLVQMEPELDLYEDEWSIRSLQRQLPAAKFVRDGNRHGIALDSLVASGCVVCGAKVHRSILFSKVRVGAGSLIEDTLVLPNVSVGRDVRLRRTIVDKHCILPDGLHAGFDPALDRQRFHVTERGIVLITPEMLGQHWPSST